MNKKIIGILVCFLFIGVNFIPNISGNLNKPYNYFNNKPPDKPSTPLGPFSGETNVLYSFSSSSSDDKNEIYIMWDWGDETSSSWIGPFNNEITFEEEHSWINTGDYEIKVKAKDKCGQESKWSEPLTISIPKNKKSIVTIFIEIVERFPRLFPIFERIYGTIKKDFENNDETEFWGLLIAVGEYLNHPEQDRPSMLIEVEHLYETLIDSRNWQSSHIRKIKGESATLENIINGLKWILQMDDGDDFSFVYITTHGGVLDFDIFPFDEADGKDEILVPYEGFDDTSTVLWDDHLNILLSFLDSKGTCLMVDSCYSGGFNDEPLLKKSQKYENNYITSSGNQIKNDEINSWVKGIMEEMAGNSRVVLMSSEENELSFGSTFSYYVINGLDGYGDDNSDGVCSAEEAFYYAKPLVEQIGLQHPTILDNYIGEFPLTRLIL